MMILLVVTMVLVCVFCSVNCLFVYLLCRFFLVFVFCLRIFLVFFFFFKQKTAYVMLISDWSSDVCSSDLFVFVGHHFLFGLDEAAVLAGQANCFAAGLVDHHDDVLLHLPAQHPLDDFHGFRIGHAHALDEGAFLAYALKGGIDLGAAAVPADGVTADQFEQHHVGGNTDRTSG